MCHPNITLLVGLMEQQRQWQEQLAREQRQRQEELADEQWQRQEAMAQQQTEKLNHLMAEQQLQGKLLLQQQRKVEEQMDSIKDDLAETKVIMEGGFQAAKETLEVMRHQLSEVWQACQSSLHKELQEDFQAELLVLRKSEEVQQKKEQPEHTESKPSISLRPGAPEFIPSLLPPLSTGADSCGVH